MKSFIASFSFILVFLTVASCMQQDNHQALGILVRDRVVLTATSGEIILQQPIKEGSAVAKGDLLAQLDDRRQQAIVAQAEAELNAAKAILNKLENGPREEVLAEARAKVAGNKAELHKAKLSLTRVQQLVKQKAMSQQNLDESEADLAAKAANLQVSREQLIRLEKGSRSEDVAQAQAQVQAAIAHLEQKISKLDELKIVATRDGWLDDLPWNVGERVFTGSPIAVLIASNTPYARIYIPEPFRAGIKEGDTLNVHVDGVDTVFNGTVRWVAKQASFTPYFALNEEERSRLMYLAEVLLPVSASDLPSGLPAQVDLP